MNWHTHPIEVVFLITSILTSGAAYWALKQAQRDIYAQIALKINGERKIMADTGKDQASVFLFVGLTMLGAAMLSLVFEPPPPEYRYLPQMMTWAVAWIIVSIGMFLWVLRGKTGRDELKKLSPISVEKPIGSVAPLDALEQPKTDEALAHDVQDAREHSDVRQKVNGKTP